MLDHLYSPQMSDLFVKLLNYNKSVLTKKEQPSSSTDNSTKPKSATESSSPTEGLSEVAAQEIRDITVFGIIQRMGTAYSFDQ